MSSVFAIEKKERAKSLTVVYHGNKMEGCEFCEKNFANFSLSGLLGA